MELYFLDIVRGRRNNLSAGFRLEKQRDCDKMGADSSVQKPGGGEDGKRRI